MREGASFVTTIGSLRRRNPAGRRDVGGRERKHLLFQPPIDIRFIELGVPPVSTAL